MNSIRCSRSTVALLFVAVLLAAVGPVSAIAVSSEGVPTSSRVGDGVQVTYTIDDPFTDAPNEWTLQGETELVDVRWTVTVLRAGAQVSQETYTKQTFNHSLAVDNNGDEVVVTLDGTTPEVSNYTYSPEETYLVTTLDQTTGDNSVELANASAHHYTAESKEARNAIEKAEAAIEEAPGDNAEAREQLDRARSAYDSENWRNAVSLAGDAESQAQKAQQSQQTTNMLLMGGGIVLVLALIGGGIYYWKSQQETVSRL